MSQRRFDITITDVAEADLEELYDYTCEMRSVEMVQILLDKVQEIVATLEAFPERGSRPIELQIIGTSEIRQLLQWPYRIICEINGSVVEVFAVVDGRRDSQTLLQSRLLRR
jgi:toxin ParE1/3/4